MLARQLIIRTRHGYDLTNHRNSKVVELRAEGPREILRLRQPSLRMTEEEAPRKKRLAAQG